MDFQASNLGDKNSQENQTFHSTVENELPFMSMDERSNLYVTSMFPPVSVAMDFQASHLCLNKSAETASAPNINVFDTMNCTSNLMMSTSDKDSTFSDDNQRHNFNNLHICSTEESKKQNHSEIEKRRRDKMNRYIIELSNIIPVCEAMPRKLDKLTVLRMAAQHIKTMKGSLNNFSGGGQEIPSFLSDDILTDLVSKVSDGFMFVVSCEGGKILFVSHSVSQVLNYSQSDLKDQNWFNILHPKDVAKVKEQLSASDLFPKEKLIDAKTMLPIKTRLLPKAEWRQCPGAKRSFFCRMKYKSATESKDEMDTTGRGYKKRKLNATDRKYCVIHCVGYLKSLCSEKIYNEKGAEPESEHLNCLVAIGRSVQQFNPNNFPSIESKPLEFVSRHAKDGKCLFVDQRATFLLGYLPQELLGTTYYEYCHPDDIKILAEGRKLAHQSKNNYYTAKKYRFRTKSGFYIYLQTTWKIITNPWTRDFEYFIAMNNCVPDSESVDSPLSKLKVKQTRVSTINDEFTTETTKFNEMIIHNKNNNYEIFTNDSWRNSEVPAVTSDLDKNNVFVSHSTCVTNNCLFDTFHANKSHQNMSEFQKVDCTESSSYQIFDNNCANHFQPTPDCSAPSFVQNSVENENTTLVNFWSTLTNITSSTENYSIDNYASTTTNNVVSVPDVSVEIGKTSKSVEGKSDLQLCESAVESDENAMALINSFLENNDVLEVDFNGLT